MVACRHQAGSCRVYLNTARSYLVFNFSSARHGSVRALDGTAATRRLKTHGTNTKSSAGSQAQHDPPPPLVDRTRVALRNEDVLQRQGLNGDLVICLSFP